MKAFKWLSGTLALTGLLLLGTISSCEIGSTSIWGNNGGGSNYNPTIPTYPCSPSSICLTDNLTENEIHQLISEAETGDSIIFSGLYFHFDKSGINLENKREIVLIGENTMLDFDLPGETAVNINYTDAIQVEGLSFTGDMKTAISAESAENSVINLISVESSGIAIAVRQSSDITISYVSIENSRFGVQFDRCNNCEIANGGILSSWTGINIRNSSGIIISGMHLADNVMGMVISNTANFNGTNDFYLRGNSFYTNNGTINSTAPPPNTFELPGTGILIAGVKNVTLKDNEFEGNCQSAVAVLNRNTFEQVSGPFTDGYVENIRLEDNLFFPARNCEYFEAASIGGVLTSTELDLLTDGLFDPALTPAGSVCTDDPAIRFMNLNLESIEGPSDDVMIHMCD